jgi:exodeoxyribonuclease V beta subunit
LTTVHKSKGLEYPVVYCPFLWAGDEPRGSDSEFVRFHDPDADHALSLDLGSEDIDEHKAISSQEALAEGLRLLYVALTRAKHRVCVVVPDTKAIMKSGLGYCLFGGGSREELEQRSKSMSGEDREAAVFALGRKLGPNVSVRRFDAQATKVPPVPERPPRDLRARIVRRTLDQTRRVSSFSGLTAVRAGAHAELGRDHDAAAQASTTQEGQERSSLVLDGFPRGAAAGQLIHEVLENFDFRGTGQHLQEVVEDKLAARGYPGSLSHELVAGLDQVMRTPLTEALALGGVERSQRVDEMEFVLPVTAALTPQSLERAFREHRAPTALPNYASELKDLGFEKLNGFLRGFIDLVFVHQGRFYVVDYKSNRLGPRADDYRQEGLVRAMAEHHYFLQYHLYCVALHRHLALRVPDYSYEAHFGGVYYLFLRGMAPEHERGTGIFFDRPSAELIASLERALGEHSGAEFGGAA